MECFLCYLYILFVIMHRCEIVFVFFYGYNDGFGVAVVIIGIIIIIYLLLSLSSILLSSCVDILVLSTVQYNTYSNE